MTISDGLSITVTFGGGQAPKFTLSYNTDGELAAAMDKTGEGDMGVAKGAGIETESASPATSSKVT
jgi:hypothetical protein